MGQFTHNFISFLGFIIVSGIFFKYKQLRKRKKVDLSFFIKEVDPSFQFRMFDMFTLC